MSYVELEKSKAQKMAEDALERLRKWRHDERTMLIDNELHYANKPTWWKKLFRIKPITREQAIERLSCRHDMFMSPLDEINLTFGHQEEVCLNVLRACRVGGNTVCVSLRDLRRIS